MKKLGLALAGMLLVSAAANAEPVTSTDRFEQGDYCSVTTTTIYDDNTIESRTVSCEDYDNRIPYEPGNSVPAPAVNQYAESQVAALKQAGLLVAFHQVIGLDRKIMWYPDLRLKALRKLTLGKTPAQVSTMIDQIGDLDRYRLLKASDFYLFLARLSEDWKQEEFNKSVFKGWSYRKENDGEYQTFVATLDYEGKEGFAEFMIYSK